MTKYITTKKFKGLALCNENLNIPYGEPIENNGGMLTWNGRSVCLDTSDNGFRHFSYDEDGRGKERGALTYAIAYGDQGSPVAFSDEENALWREKWGKYLRNLSDANIVNADFYRAPIEDLEEMAADLHFVKKKGRYVYTGEGPTPLKGPEENPPEKKDVLDMDQFTEFMEKANNGEITLDPDYLRSLKPMTPERANAALGCSYFTKK